MQLLLWLVIIWIVIFGSFYAWKRSIIKSLFWTNTIFFLTTAIFGVLIYQDVADLKENIALKPKLFVVLNEERPLAAFSATDMSEIPDFMDAQALAKVREDYDSRYYASGNSSYYKTFVFTLAALEKKVPDTLQYDEFEITSEDAREMIRASDPREYFFDILGEELIPEEMMLVGNMKETYLEQLGGPEEFRSQVFALILGTTIDSEGSLVLVSLMHDGGMKVLPESIAFKFIKSIPSYMVEKMAVKLKNQVGEGP